MVILMVLNDDLINKVKVFLSVFDLKLDLFNINNKIIIKNPNNVNTGYILKEHEKLSGVSYLNGNILKFDIYENKHKDGYYFYYAIITLNKKHNDLKGTMEISTSRLYYNYLIKGECSLLNSNNRFMSFRFGSLSNSFNIADYNNEEYANFYKNSFRYEKRNEKLLNIKYEDGDILYDKNKDYLDNTSVFGYINDVYEDRIYNEYINLINTYGNGYFRLLNGIKLNINEFKNGLFENYIKFLDESVVNNFFNENKKDVLCYYLHR